MEHTKHEPGFEPIPLHIPVPPMRRHPPEKKRPDDSGPKHDMDIDAPEGDTHRGSMTINRDGKVESDEDDREDDRMKEW